MEKQVPCMERPKFTPPDSRNWVFLGVGDRPLATAGETPVAAHLPMSEVSRILAMAAYVNASIAACEAARSAAP